MIPLPAPSKTIPPPPSRNRFTQLLPLLSAPHGVSRSPRDLLPPLPSGPPSPVVPIRRTIPPFPTLGELSREVARAMDDPAPLPLAGKHRASASPAFLETLPFFSLEPSQPSKASAPRHPAPPASPKPSAKSASPFTIVHPAPSADGDLQAAIEKSLEKAISCPTSGLQLYLEPLLRTTLRRALSEHLPSSSPFNPLATSERISTRLKAIFSSRSLDEVIFEKLHRYQVEEVFLLHLPRLGLLSHASQDPGRHSNSRSIRADLTKLRADAVNSVGNLLPEFDLPESRVAVLRKGQTSLLLAIVRGRSNPLLESDLDFALRQIEQRFGSRLGTPTEKLHLQLQSILEACLLIRSPLSPEA